MRFATPDNLEHLPVWRNYLCGQLTHASLGMLSPRIVLAGVEEEGEKVALHFLVDPPLSEDYPEIAQIVDEFNDLTGDQLQISTNIQVWEPGNDPQGVDWVYRRWLGWESV
ncbi:hypothetical protein [Actinotalea caeni]|uniref:hypothetical protein n=1 Tax=Actinotalea caeni TaxID=1348467 RepID=UPI0012E1CD41|nr:hypothetical protein [Actinotalea caeni]